MDNTAFRSLFNFILLPSSRSLQPWEVEYFRHLQAEWEVLNLAALQPSPPTPGTPATAQPATTAPDPIAQADIRRVAELVRRFNIAPAGSAIHRSDLLDFEQTILRHRSVVSLVQIAPVLRQRFHDVVGDRTFSAYRPTETPDVANASPAQQRALYDDLATLVSAIHWRYVLFPFNSQLRRILASQALVCMLLYTALWGMVIFFSAHRGQGAFVAVFITCIFAGVLGGFISALRRLQSVNDDGDAVLVIQGIRSASFWLWFSPMLGGIFAVVALLFFIGGFLSGSIFPAFHTPADFQCGGADAGTACGLLGQHWWVWQHLIPASPSDHAKLYLWCFISGFAERFIPDMIDNLISKADPAKSTGASGAPVAIGRAPQGQGGPAGAAAVPATVAPAAAATAAPETEMFVVEDAPAGSPAENTATSYKLKGGSYDLT